MSQAALERLARKWRCSVPEAVERIRLRLVGVGVIDDQPVRPYAGERVTRMIRIVVDEESDEYFLRVGDRLVPLDG